MRKVVVTCDRCGKEEEVFDGHADPIRDVRQWAVVWDVIAAFQPQAFPPPKIYPADVCHDCLSDDQKRKLLPF
jgi:hypothetical protein